MKWYDKHPKEIESSYVFAKQCLLSYVTYKCMSKEFVDKKRESKLNEMMNSFNPNPFNARPMPQPNMNQKKDDSFDIDSLVKKIDAKIAELEEQEKQEQANKSVVGKIDPIKVEKKVDKNIKENFVNNFKPVSQSLKVDNQSIPKVEQQKNILENPNLNVPNIELKEESPQTINGITDDQFFDDFFNDEE